MIKSPDNLRGEVIGMAVHVICPVLVTPLHLFEGLEIETQSN